MVETIKITKREYEALQQIKKALDKLMSGIKKNVKVEVQ